MGAGTGIKPAAGAAGFGTILQLFSGILQAKTQSDLLKEQASFSDEQAKIAEENSAIKVGEARFRSGRLQSAIVAETGGSGVQFSGSPLLVQLEAARLAEREVQQIKRGFAEQAKNLRRKAQSLRRQRLSVRRSSIVQTGTTLLSGGLKTAQFQGLI